MLRYEVKLYNPEGALVKKEHFNSHHLAWGSGENWNMLTKGNSYKIEDTQNMEGTGLLPMHARIAMAYVVTKPTGEKLVWAPKGAPEYLNQLKQSFPGITVTNKDIVPAYVLSNPKSHGWQIQTVASKTAIRIDEETFDEVSEFISTRFDGEDRDTIVEQIISLFMLNPTDANEMYDIIEEERTGREGVSGMDLDHTIGRPGGSYDEFLDSIVGFKIADAVFSKENLQKTIQDVVEKKDKGTLMRWLGLAGGKQKLLPIIQNLSKSFNTPIPQEFYDVLNEASREWVKAPRSKYVKVY